MSLRKNIHEYVRSAQKNFQQLHQISLKEVSMPVKKCGGSGYKWGNSGKCYKRKGARVKAAKQGRAAYANGYKGKGKK